MRQAIIGLLGITLIGATARSAAAQQPHWSERIFVNVSVGGQGGSDRFSSSSSLPLYEETATFNTTREVKGGALFDLVVGAEVRRPFSVAFAYSRRADNRAGLVDGSIPDPIVFDQPRQASASVGGLRHRENWFAPMAVWTYPLTPRMDLMVMGGPAFVRLEHDQIGTVSVSESGSGPQLSATATRTRSTKAGGIVIADVRYMILDKLGVGVGVGGFVRYAGAASAGVANGQSIDLGGFQGGGGVRIQF